MNPKKIFENIGPGPIITAAFIGPGTVTVCTLAGIQFDYTLLWALVLSIIATLFLQEISGRLGIITKKDLGELIRNQAGNPLFKWTSLILILVAIGIGNAAYQGGNISGANLGLGIFWEAPVWNLGSLKIQSGNLIIGLLAFFLLWSGSYKRLEQTLIGLVILMSLSFLTTTLLIHPDWGLVFSGFIPSFSEEKFPTIVALIGTTVVPYNLFLYASLVKKQWQKPKDLTHMRKDIGLSVVLGGLVSMAIVLVGVANPSESLNSAQDIAKGLTGVFGDFGTYLMGFGLLGAGLTSSLTAPLAGGLVICGLLGWNQDIQSKSMRGVMGTILLLGIIFSSFGIRPVTLITLAQLANGILLPIISAWLIWAGSQKIFLGTYVSKPSSLIFGIIIWILTFILGMKSIWTVLGFTF
ncbi:Nramp family divalent metal transporter [Algoriphagus sanaruensis]|uniref:Manganese transporter n=1 Tax=Algoriphagus sanaruensis TaxID=1727163 RepID=A0A142ENE7_9BACT|nr:Nramp family divalent metal transporter [Algoriphagus sanaruensis]AMQ56652.1 manganese transporter [Algoriphagus sanaruensis]